VWVITLKFALIKGLYVNEEEDEEKEEGEDVLSNTEIFQEN
jgi:hypothetical protein